MPSTNGKNKPTQILIDKASGKDLNRQSYQALKSNLGLRAGDTLYITSLDRLSRNKEEIKQELKWFKDNNIRLKILDLPTSMVEVAKGQEWIIEMITNILIEVLSSVAEQERLTIRKRQKEGIDAAKRKGKHMGRPKVVYPNNFVEVYGHWKTNKLSAKQAMRTMGLSSSTFYRLVKQYEECSVSKGS
ncbi:MAG: recombinase family protein [Lachnospiraceae bacterium]|nr:recombinase family protein [Lachnospiraceae bacterium]